jgi:hypothetical protein
METYLGQIVTTAKNLRESWLPIWDRCTDVGVHLIMVLLSFKEDVKINYQALQLQLEQPHGPPPAVPSLKLRNTIQELYFGLALLMAAVCTGELVGSTMASGFFRSALEGSPIAELFLFFLLPFYAYVCTILSIIFPADTSVQVLLLCVLPIFAYKHMRKPTNTHTVDGYERRTWLFTVVFAISTLLGTMMGRRLLATAPTLLFIPPFVFALLLDSTLPLDLYNDLTKLRSLASVCSMCSVGLLACVVGVGSPAWIIVSLVQCVILSAHFEVVVRHVADEDFEMAENQFLYVVALLFLQVPVAFVFGKESVPPQVLAMSPPLMPLA